MRKWLGVVLACRGWLARKTTNPPKLRTLALIQARLSHASAKTLDVYGHLFADVEDHTDSPFDARLSS